MGDPLSVAANVAGLLSLGIQVTQTLVTYYTAYQNQDSHIARTTSKLRTLLQSFQSLSEALDRRSFHTDERALVAQIESSIEDCNDLIIELKQEFDKFSRVSNSGIKDGIKTTGRRLAYPFRQSTLQKLEEDIGEIRENLSLALNVLQLNNDKRIQDDVYELKSILNLVRTSQVSQELREWLKAPDATANYHEACAKKHANSGMWFVKGAAFIKWLEDDASFLWLNGFSGCGKSVLCSTAIQHTFRHQQRNSHIGIAFFYFSFNDNSKQNVSGLLRAILLQLSSQLNDGHVDLAGLYNSYGNGEAPVPALVNCVQQVVLKFQDVYLLVDALDECPRHDTRERMLETISAIRAWSLNSLHILVTSRDELDIREYLNLSSNQEVSMKNAGIDKDIEDFVRDQLEQDRALQKWSSYHPQIQEALKAKAGGVFRWVECQLRSLKSCPRSEDRLEILLTSLPHSLDETYERMLLNIDIAFVEDARRVLMWLCFCKRPLTVRELIDGVAIELGDNARLNRKRRLQDENDILQICPGFISIALSNESDLDAQNDKLAYVVCIAHYSVQEYLESHRICQQKTAIFSMRSTISVPQIAQMCLVYLLDPVLSEARATHSTLDELPLAQYAAEYWYNHVKASDTSLSDIHFYVMQLFRDRGHTFQNIINIYDHDEPFRRSFTEKRKMIASKVYYAALLGLDLVLKELLDARNEQYSQTQERIQTMSSNDLDINAQGGRFGNALQAASAEGHEKVVQLLLHEGANVNAQGGQYGNALQAASTRGHEKVVRLLLDRGADISAQGGRFGNALQAASAEGHEKVVHLLLHEGANVNAQGGQYGNALQAASIKGRDNVAQLLLDRGADVSAQSGDHSNAPEATSDRGFKNVSYAFQYSNCTGRRKALLIGINYFGQRGQLRGCINDVRNVSNFLNQNFGYAREDMVILTDDQQDPRSQPSKANILRAMHWLVKDARPNDSLFFHYSGHGGQTLDLDDDGYDEVIYPVDFRTHGYIVDDEMHRIMVKPLSPGVRLTAIFDSCNSGSALDLPYVYSTQGVLKEPNLAKEAGNGLLSIVSSYARGHFGGMTSAAVGGNNVYETNKRRKTSLPDVIMWSGSKAEQNSQDANIAGQATGCMSWAFITALKKNRHQSYVQLLNSIRDEIATKYSQKPQLSCSYPLNTDLPYVM